MNTRRQFFGQITTILAAASAPSILLPKSIDKFVFKANNATKIVVFKTRKLKAIWTCELEQDLHVFYSIDAAKEIQKTIHNIAKEELHQNNILTQNEHLVSVECTPLVIDPSSFTPYKGLIVTTKVYV